MIRAFILAGGLGTRLSPAIGELPKPLAPIAGKPFIYYPINWLHRQGIADITLCLGYHANEVMQALGDGEQFEVRITYSVENEPLGTGGAIRLALRQRNGPALVINGDTYFEMDVAAFLISHRTLNGSVTLALIRTPSGHSRGCVELTPDGFIRSFVEKPDNYSGEVLINAGIYFFDDSVDLESYPEKKFSLERDYFPILARAGRLTGYISEGYFIDIGTPESWRQFERDVLGGMIDAHP